jgi:hypothetical protein
VRIHRKLSLWKHLLLGFILVWAIAGCKTIISSNQAPLPAVTPLPLPQLPDWIEQISPTGEANALAQIRIRFKEPLIPVERLDSPDQQDALKQFEVVPPLPGRFRFLTPRMVGFQADQALPNATRVKVTLKAGLSDLKNHRLTQDLAWTFNTTPIALTNLPGKPLNSPDAIEPIALRPTLEITSNVELDLASLEQHAVLLTTGQTATPAAQTQGISLKAALKTDAAPTPDAGDRPQEQFDPSQKTWVYTLTPQRDLDKATTYRFQVTPGLQPAHGNVASEMPFVSQIATYGPLAFQKLQYDGQPSQQGVDSRFTNGNAQLQFILYSAKNWTFLND